MRQSRLSRSICGVLAMGAVIAGGASAAPAQRIAGSGFALPGAELPLAAAMLDSSLLHLRAGVFDPLVAPLAPVAPALAPAGETRYGIAQFHPRRMPSQSRLAALGIDVVAYLPDNAYLVRWNGARAAIAALPETRWTGPYLPGYKFDPTLWSAPVTDLTLIGFPGTDADRFSATLEKRVPGLIRIARYDDPQQPRVHVRVPLAQLNAALVEVAKLEEVLFIEPYAAPELLNDDAYGPIQANVPSNITDDTDTPIWSRGITGSGQIVTVADSGLDRNHCSFVQLNKGNGVVRAFTNADDPAVTPDFAPPNIANLYPDRKVIGYWVQPGATAYDNTVACVSIGAIPSPTSFHGTHVVGSVLGDRGVASTPTSAGYDEEVDPPVGTETKPGDGMAPNAQVLFQDIGNDDTGCLSGIGVLDDMFEQARRGGARIHSNSWGAATKGVYTGFDADADRGVYNHEDMLVVFAAGNSGAAATTTGSPANAKNVLTVGANAHGNNAAIASFSSRGPTADGRIKPEVTAPGTATVSARGDNINDGVPLDQVETTQCAAQSLSGTSMATPTVAGGAALMRQYFTDGFYPTGSRTVGNAYSPSGALMKAVLMNGTSMPATLPNQTFGWGRIWLDNNLYFPNDDRKLRHFDVPNSAGLETGEEQVWTIDVPPGAPRELRATLTWFDPPGTPAAAKALVNDLDLEVVGPNGTFLGNVFTVDESSAGGTRDVTNNTEVVRLKTANQGPYTLRVRGTSVPGSGLEGSTRQGYALAVSSRTCATLVAAAPAAPVATDLGVGGISVAVTAPANATTTQVYRASGTCATAASEFRLIGSTAGGTLVDPKVTGGFPYAYRVRGADVCGEGPISSCTEVVSTAACDLVPSFDVNTVTATNNPSGSTCGTLVSWTAGAARCPTATSLRYNVYRSTAFDFTPGPTNLIASGVAATSYSDVAVDPLQTYFYVVRAEDSTTDGTGPANGGNESTATRRVNVVAHGAMVPGTYADSVDVAAFMNIETPWAISNDAASDGTLSYRSAADNATIYLPEQCAAITTPPILLGAGSPSLSYDAKYNVEDQWDGVVVEITDDGGATWDDLPPSPTYPSTFAQTQAPPVNACGYAATHGAFGGSSGGVFTSHSSALSSYAGRTVQLRWRFSSDSAAEEAGFFLDKLRITNAAMPSSCARLDRAPTAVNDAATVVEDSGANAIDVLANDTDPDGGPKTIVSVTQPTNGSVAITGNGSALGYTPNANFCSTTADTFTYQLNGNSSATVSVMVTCVDDAPTAVADTATVGEDSGATAIDVLANDANADGGPKSIASVTQPASGAVVVTGNGTGLTYAPNANFCSATADSFTYALNGGSSTTVSVTVACVDDAPTAVGDVANVARDSGATAINVLANDTDIDGGTKSVASATQPANGTVVITGSGTGLTYAPNAGYCAATPDTFTYTLNGGSSANVSVLVSCPADAPPTAVADSATVGEDSGASAINVLANDTDTDGGPKSIAGVTQPTNGTVIVTGGGSGLTYAPNANFCSTAADTFTYALNGGSSTTVSVTVTCVDDVPVAIDDTATVAEDSGPTAINVLTNDTDVDGGTKSIQSVTQPANGVVTIAGGSGLSFTPDAQFCSATPQAFDYMLNGGSIARVTVTVTCIDDPPSAVNDVANVAQNAGATALDVLANDTDVDGGTRSVASTTQPANGTVVITGSGTGLTYAPNAGYCATTPDTFTYALNGGSSATVSVLVSCAADAPPTAVADNATVAEDSGASAINVLANDTDTDGGPRSIASVTQPANGTVVVTGGGTGLTYAPKANFCSTTADSFTYALNGGSSATVTVTVTCVDDAPTAVSDETTVAEDSGATPVDVLANDIDADGGPRTIMSVTQPANGTVVIAGGGTDLTYAPNANFCSTSRESFAYTLNGGSLGFVTITVTCVDDAPAAVADSTTVAQGSGATAIAVLGNDTDIDAGPRTIISTTQPANGTVAITGSGSGLTYRPNAAFCGTTPDTFTYTLNGNSSATVSVSVTCDSAGLADAIFSHGFENP